MFAFQKSGMALIIIWTSVAPRQSPTSQNFWDSPKFLQYDSQCPFFRRACGAFHTSVFLFLLRSFALFLPLIHLVFSLLHSSFALPPSSTLFLVPSSTLFFSLLLAAFLLRVAPLIFSCLFSPRFLSLALRHVFLLDSSRFLLPCSSSLFSSSLLSSSFL